MIYRKRNTAATHATSRRPGLHLVVVNTLPDAHFAHRSAADLVADPMLDMRTGEKDGALAPSGATSNKGEKPVPAARSARIIERFVPTTRRKRNVPRNAPYFGHDALQDVTDAAWNQMSVAEHFYAMAE